MNVKELIKMLQDLPEEQQMSKVCIEHVESYPYAMEACEIILAMTTPRPGTEKESEQGNESIVILALGHNFKLYRYD